MRRLRQCPHVYYVWEIWRRSFISTVRPLIHSTLISHKKGAFRKRSSTGESWKRQLCVIVWAENLLTTELFENNGVGGSRQCSEFPAWPSVSHKSKMVGIYHVLRFLRRGVNGKHLTRFQSETNVFKLIQRSVDGALVASWSSVIERFSFECRK